MRSHFNVVTTEPEGKIADILRLVNLKVDNYYTIDSYKSRAMQLNKSDMLVIIDRQKAGSDILLLERLIGITANEIGPDSVLVSSFLRQGTEEGRRILLTAPDEQSLYKEMNQIFMVPELTEKFEETGFNVVRKYDVINMQVISNLDNKSVSDWITSISRHGGDVYNWTYIPAADFKLGTDTSSCYVLMLNSVLPVNDSVRSLLNKDYAGWLNSDGRFNQQAALSSIVPVNNEKVQVYAFAAPGNRHIKTLLSGYDALSAVPDTLNLGSLRDFSQIKNVGLTIYRKNPADAVLGSALNSLGEQFRSSLTGAGLGLSIDLFQDTAVLQAWEKNLGTNVYANMDGIAVLQITDYQGPSAPSITAFSLAKPKPPTAPKKTDKSYAAKLKKYRVQQKDYTKKLASWESKRLAHQQRLSSVSKQWFSQEFTSGECSISGTFRLYSNSDQGSTLLIELPFYGSANTNNVRKPSISQAFALGCRDLAVRLQRNSVFAADTEGKN